MTLSMLPGARRGVAIEETSGQHVALLDKGDSFDLFVGKTTIQPYSIETATALRLARFVVWWWIWRSWCGLRPWLWHRRMLRRLNA